MKTGAPYIRKLRQEIRVLQFRLREANRGAETNARIIYMHLDRLSKYETKLRELGIDPKSLYQP